MRVIAPDGATGAVAPDRPDPFSSPPPAARRPRRPRVLAHMGRWGRARRWLPPDARRVLDVGCASAYGTAALAGTDGRRLIGIERDHAAVLEAARRRPWLTVLEGDASALPVADGVADAVTMLDVLEHLEDPRAAIAEAHRVLAPGGCLVVSVPHRGALHGLDALNLYDGLCRDRPGLPPLAAPTTSGGHAHHHYTVEECEQLLRPWFTVERVARRGLGIHELITLGLLAMRRRGGRPRTARALLGLYVVVYLLEDALPTGPVAYHLMLRARAVTPA